MTAGDGRGLADTSVFIATETGRPLGAALARAELAVSVVTIGELRFGVLAAQDDVTRQRRLTTLIKALDQDPVPIDEAVTESWAALQVALRAAGRRLPINDSWIAATAIALGVPVYTQDDDHTDVPGLSVVRV